MSFSLVATTRRAIGSPICARRPGRHRRCRNCRWARRRRPAAPARRGAGRPDIVDRLGHDAGPVDRVDRREAQLAGGSRASANIAFTRSWQSSKVPRDRDVEDVGRLHGGHLPPLHRRDPAMRVQHGDADAAACRRRRGRRRPRCRPRWRRRWSPARRGGPGPRRTSRARSCIAKSLKARVGPWNSSSSQSSAAELAQGCGGGMGEAGIGVRRRAAGGPPRRSSRR